MALAAATTWEGRASGAGVSDNNSGGYVPGSSGTDFSQQNSPQYAITTATSAGAGNTLLTAAAAADMVGNIAKAISGTNVNPGDYQVLSVVVGVSITFGTNNASGSIAAGVVSGGTLNIGGARLTVGSIQGSVAPGNTAYLNGVFTVTAEIAISTISTAGPLSYIGYSVTRGDNGKATIQTSTNSVDIINVANSNNVTLRNLTLIVTAGTPGSCINARTQDGARLRLINCLINGGAFGIRGNRSGADFGIQGLSLEFCEIKNAVSHGVVNTFLTAGDFCFIHDNGGAGFFQDQATSSSYWFHTVFYKNAQSGVNVTDSNGTPQQQNHNFYKCDFSTNTGAGILSTAGAPTLRIEDNVFDRNTTFGIDLGTAAGASFVIQYNNAFFAGGVQTARRANADVFPAVGDITLTADPYTTVGSNFAPNSNAGGGAALNGAGAPGTIPNAGSGTENVGALDPAAGGGTTTVVVFGPNITQIFEGES